MIEVKEEKEIGEIGKRRWWPRGRRPGGEGTDAVLGWSPAWSAEERRR